MRHPLIAACIFLVSCTPAKIQERPLIPIASQTEPPIVIKNTDVHRSTPAPQREKPVVVPTPEDAKCLDLDADDLKQTIENKLNCIEKEI